VATDIRDGKLRAGDGDHVAINAYRHETGGIITEPGGAQVESVINEYISREIVQDAALLPLSNESSLLEAGILDSLSLLQLVVFLEGRFKITVGEADLLPENFDTINAICAYLRAREPGRRGAAHG
jgi:acyl carrier protein